MAYVPISNSKSGGGYKPISQKKATPPLFPTLDLVRQASMQPKPPVKKLEFSVAPKETATAFPIPSTTSGSTKAVDTEAKAPLVQEIATAAARDVLIKFPYSSLEGLYRLGKSVLGPEGERGMNAFTQKYKPLKTPLGEVESYQQLALKDIESGGNPLTAGLKQAGSVALDEPVGFAFKPMFLVLGMLGRKLVPKAVTKAVDEIATLTDEAQIYTKLTDDLGIKPEYAKPLAPVLKEAKTADEVMGILQGRDEALARQAGKIPERAPEPPVRDEVPVARSVSDDVPIKVEPPVRTATETVGRTADDVLVEEARKYKSADEFVKAQGTPVYRGTVGKNLEDTSSGLKILPDATFTTTAKQTAKGYAGDAGTVHELVISPDAKFFETSPQEIAQWLKKKERELFPLVQEQQMFADAKKGVVQLDEITKKNINVSQQAKEEYGKWLRTNGYDGYSMKRENGIEYAVINKDKIKTRSQLTDIYNRAHAPQTLAQLPTVPPPVRPRGQQAIDNALQTYAGKAKQYKQAPLPEKVPARTTGGVKRIAGELLTPISSRLGRIAPELKKGIRRFETKVASATAMDSQAITPILQVTKKMSGQDKLVWDLARKNGDKEAMDALATKYGFTKELAQTRKTLDSLYLRAKDAGMDIGYKEGYFPRIVKNPEAYLRYLRNDPKWSEIQELIRKHAETKGIKYTDLSDEEMASIVNLYVRGYGDRVTLASPSPTKARSIEAIDQELNRFYEDSDTALATYVVRMNDEIAAREFFGKGEDISESIGAYLIKLGSEGKIHPADIPEAADVLKSRFARGKMNGAIDVYRNAEYISTMGSPISAITQLGDLAFPAYENGVYHTLKGLGKTLTRTGVSKEALGIEKITQEFMSASKTGKLLDQVFKWTGLSTMDRLGKETLVNSTFSKLRAWAKGGDKRLYDELDKILNADEIPLAIQELKAGQVTERTKAVLLNKVMEYQPITKSEMPQKYLEMPNGRVFYMLKSFTLKQVDIFRRESIDLITSGDPKKVAQGIGNLVKLSGMFMLANMGADKLKDVILGRETDIEDTVVDNLWRLVGASKYDVYKARTDGVGMTVLKKILFPSSIVDRASTDVYNTATDREYEKGPMKGEDFKLESTQSIPIGGKLYYWWMGRGAQKEEYKENSESTSGSMPSLPELPSLPSLPSLPKI